ncbi:MAG TPA: MBL fold metallo-hydrolase [archaeon]|nr:MBL fold metallo-hydrolase [archaeon]
MDIQFSVGNGIAVKLGNKENILLDPRVADFISFTTHAHSDHMPQKIVRNPYCSPETYELAKLRNPEFDGHKMQHGKWQKFDNFRAKLISSGHVLGSSMVFIEADGTSILYTGDFKLWPGLSSKPIDIEHADVLVTEATYGHPSYQLPHIDAVRNEIISFVNNHRKQHTVNLGGYPIGKAQEAIKLLNMHDIVPSVSENIANFSDVYKKFGFKLDFIEDGADVSVLPMHVISQMSYNNELNGSKNAVLTGWAVSRKYHNGVAAFPLSDHCDFNQLLAFVEAVEPKKVFTVHGFEREFAKTIRSKLKIPASPLLQRSQKLLTEY